MPAFSPSTLAGLGVLYKHSGTLQIRRIKPLDRRGNIEMKLWSGTSLLLSYEQSYGTARYAELKEMQNYKVLASLHIKPKAISCRQAGRCEDSLAESTKAFESTRLRVDKA